MSNRSNSKSSGSKKPFGKKGAGSFAIVILIGLYAFAQPHLNERFGWSLPGLKQTDRGEATVATAAPKPPPSSPMRDQPSAADESTDLHYGLLREIRPDEFLSPQGLQYASGSAEGHRLEHLRRHTKDMPSRPGKHGVFDGDMEGALVTIDKAYQRAKNNQKTTKQTDRDRTIYTVDMGQRVGYVGGIDGNRQNNPMARRVKLVLEGTIFITAYPL